METIIFNCALEPEDLRNTAEIEITQNGLSIFNTHMVYFIRDRIRYAFRLLFSGIDSADIILDFNDTLKLSKFLNENIDVVNQLNEKMKEYKEDV